MIQFDTQTRLDWKDRDITNVSVYFVESGCAGTKIRVEEGKLDGMTTQISDESLLIHIKESELASLENSRITHAKGKWIFASNVVNTRCGCGSSFSLKSESPLQDKITQIKLAMKQKKEGIHQ